VTERILYVDDEPGNRLVFEQSFSDRFEIVSVASGEEALQKLATDAFAVVVTDQRMHGMTGNELLERVKQLYPEIIRVVVTAYDDVDPILQAVNRGLVARYVTKPWRRAELAELLRWAVDAYAIGQRTVPSGAAPGGRETMSNASAFEEHLARDRDASLGEALASADELAALIPSPETVRRLLREGPGALAANDLAALQALPRRATALIRRLRDAIVELHGTGGP
jgi:CheY-like chemotaxis protein